ncbi:MAG: hypothetical protein A2559_07710 [Deltaproteobacteria bacterium RIFOXYD2_FULL_66_9]|nr:MAG: hypothetical protein A2559_07710 [Deltaproteobacteria bacterium RIFOXYD2_FULL_66_9]
MQLGLREHLSQEGAPAKREELLLLIGRDEGEARSEGLVLGPPEDPLGRRVPHRDDAFGIEGDDRQRGRLDESGEDPGCRRTLDLLDVGQGYGSIHVHQGSFRQIPQESLMLRRIDLPPYLMFH